MPQPMANRAASEQVDIPRRQSKISVQRYFEVSLLLMLATSFVTLATTGKLDLLSVLAVTAALIVKLSSYARDVNYSLSPRTVNRLAIFYIFFYALDFLIFSPGPGVLDRMLQSTVHLVLFAAVIKIFSARTYRDYGYLATLAFLMMLASAVLTVGTMYMVYFTLYVVFAISTFISYEIKRATEAARQAPEGPFAAPLKNRSAVEKALMIATVGLAVGIVVLASILFFVIPRYRSGYLTALGMQAQNITGFSETVNLGDIRKILRSSIVVMQIKAEGNPRQFQGVKWRGVGLTSYDGKHWYNDNTEQFPLAPVSPERFLLPEPEGWQNRSHQTLRYRVLLSPLSTDVLFVAAVPRVLTGHLRMITLDQTESLHNPQHGYSPLGYDMVSWAGLPSFAQLRAPADYPSDIRLLYLRLPKLDPRIADLARQITASATNNYDRALAIQTYLRNNFRYTLDPPAIEPADPIGSFLFKSKQGYCEYFAAAMAIMLRTLEIPSRLVNGFQTGSYNRIGKDFIVRGRDAHSWVEVYFPNYGWITFDPTPADPNPVLPGPMDDYLDAMSLFWNEWVINYDLGHQVQLARELDQDSREFQQSVRAKMHRLRRRGVLAAYRVEAWLMSHKLLMFLLMLIVLGFLVAAEKTPSLAELRFLWTWNFGRTDVALGAREATLTYRRFLRQLDKKGFKKSPSETPWEFALTFAGSRLEKAVLEFTRLYSALRFGEESIPLSRLQSVLQQLVESSKIEKRNSKLENLGIGR